MSIAHRRLLLSVPAAVVGWALVLGPVYAGEAPQAVSPGKLKDVAQVEGHCPTFSWSSLPGATGYQLAVFGLGPNGGAVPGDELEKADPMLVVELPSGVSSWTPPLEDCFDLGSAYAWSVRAVRADIEGSSAPSAWAEARFFTVVDGRAVRPGLTRFAEAGLERSDTDDPDGAFGPATVADGQPAQALSESAVAGAGMTVGGDIVITTAGRLGVREPAPITDIQLTQSDGLIGGTGGMTFSRSTNWKILHTGSHLSFVENNVRRAYVETGTGQYVVVSDATAKRDVERLGPVLDRVMALTPETFRYVSQPEDATRTMGFVAQEVAAVFPDLPVRSEDGRLGLSYSDFAVLAIAAIQEQQLEIESLRRDNQTLRATVERVAPPKLDGEGFWAGTSAVLARP